MLSSVNDETINSKSQIKRYEIKKSTVENLFLVLLFLVSFLNSSTVLLFLVGILFLMYQKEIGAVKILNLITFRQIISPGIGADIESWQSLKLLIVMALASYLLLSYKKLAVKEKKKIKYTLVFVSLFFFYNVFVALAFSSLPTVAIFKTVSYVVVFLGVLMGVAYTRLDFNWLSWMYKLFFVLFAFSVPLLLLPVGYLRNGISFQGITNQPNMFGILMVLFIGLLLAHYQVNKKKRGVKFLLILSTAVAMVVVSDSRTSLLASIILLAAYFLYQNIFRLSMIKASLLSFLMIPIVLNAPVLFSFFKEFMIKGQTADNFLASRENQIDTLLFNFQSSPIFGNGFSVPVLQFRTYELSTEFLVDPGNLILSVLAYSGIIGFAIFAAYMLNILWSNRKKLNNHIYLFLAPILISMGEIVFFSSNNVGIWCYMFLALYMFAASKEEILKAKQKAS